MQCACATLSSVIWPAEQYFSALSHKRHDYRREKKIIEHKLCVLNFSTSFVWNISHSKKNSARYYQMYIGIHVSCYSCRILIKENGFFSTDFRKVLRYRISYISNSGRWDDPGGLTCDEAQTVACRSFPNGLQQARRSKKTHFTLSQSFAIAPMVTYCIPAL